MEYNENPSEIDQESPLLFQMGERLFEEDPGLIYIINNSSSNP